MRQFIPVLAVGFTLLAAVPPANASGSYRGRPPRLNEVDASRYHTGKDIFLGRVDPAGTQRTVLARLQEALPAAAKEKARFTEMAGRLSARRLAALVHYSAVEYQLPRLDQEAYAAGQAIFEGLTEVAEEAGPTERLQADRLVALEEELPAVAEPGVVLRSLAGRLSHDQLEALEFYTAVRYRSRGIACGRYRMGQRVFQGDLRGGGGGRDPLIAEEARLLAELEKQLPASARNRVELTALAGKLTAAQLEALEYYVAVRYKIR